MDLLEREKHDAAREEARRYLERAAEKLGMPKLVGRALTSLRIYFASAEDDRRSFRADIKSDAIVNAQWLNIGYCGKKTRALILEAHEMTKWKSVRWWDAFPFDASESRNYEASLF